jgi:5-formaminoimidazole-4-carboxamide-1-beta-D-ribofuranosyl 5'-monophosphate synthetase
VFVDGKVVGVGAATIHVPCGSHAVKVGSTGLEKTLDIPCMGSVDFE